MIRKPVSDDAACQLARQLGVTHPAVLIPDACIETIIPENLTFSPDRCFKCDTDYVLVYGIPTPEIPGWIKTGGIQLRQRKHFKLILLALDTEEISSQRIATDISEEARKLGFGLALQNGEGTYIAFPLHLKKIHPIESSIEHGHIPSWVYQRVCKGDNLSPYLRNHVFRFVSAFQAAANNHELDYERECRLLYRLAENLVDGDPHLFYPLDRLLALRSYERTGSNVSARDHFFHTFNNFFLGLIILEELFRGRDHTVFPDALISRGRGKSKLRLWESLWLLTCLFHDPGYLGEDLQSLIAFGYGVEHNQHTGDSIPVPDELIIQRKNAWDTEFLRARKHVESLYKTVKQLQQPRPKATTIRKFNSGMEAAFFKGRKTGHSLLSGLSLVYQCLSDRIQRPRLRDPTVALDACKIAALSMIFHDQDCRITLSSAGVSSIPFEFLPYASVLMFVDALQDDRRDVTKSEFPKFGVLESLRADRANGLVTAGVRLRNLPLKFWPSRIVEYENVMGWINRVSTMKFIIDYRADQGL